MILEIQEHISNIDNDIGTAIASVIVILAGLVVIALLVLILALIVLGIKAVLVLILV